MLGSITLLVALLVIAVAIGNIMDMIARGRTIRYLQDELSYYKKLSRFYVEINIAKAQLKEEYNGNDS